MSRKLRNTFLIILGVIALLLSSIIASNVIIKNKISKFTEDQLPKNIIAKFDDVSLHWLNGTLTYNNVSVQLQNKSNNTTHTYLTAENVIVEDVSYWKYLTKKEIHIEDVKIQSPIIKYYKNRRVSSKDTTKPNPLLTLNKPVLVDELSIDNATVTFFDKNDNDTLLYVQDITLAIDAIFADNTTLNKRLPVNFGDYNAKADSIFLKVSPFENLTVGNFTLKNKKALITAIRLATKFSKVEHAKLLKQELDYFDVTLKKFEIHTIDFGFNDRKFFAKSSLLEITEMDATMYRNKLIADNPTRKPLYSQILRELPIDLTIDSVAVTNSKITYEEKMKQNQPPGNIYFDNFDATMKNVSNTYPEGTKTTILATTRFMKAAPLKVNWSFDVNNTQDSFIFKADLGVLPADKMNVFTKPNLFVSLEGETEKTYISIYGTNAQSKIDMRIDYKNFKINLLKKNGKEKNRLLSGILNIFVKKNSGTKELGFSEGSATVTPDHTKSFFNYVWVNVAAALRDCLL